MYSRTFVSNKSARIKHILMWKRLRSSSKSSARASVLLSHQLSSSSGVSSDSHRTLHPCSSGSESPPSSLGQGVDDAKVNHDALSTASSGHSAPMRPRQLKHKKELHKLNSAASSSSCGTVACCQNCQARASLQVLPPSSDQEVAALRAEMENQRAELSRVNTRVQVLLESERALKERLAATAATTCNNEQGGMTGERLVRCYSNLYATARVDTLDALDNLPPLKDADELKSKILFSVIVLAFRSAQSLLHLKKDHVRRILHIPAPPPPGCPHPPIDPITAELERSVCVYLRRTVESFDLTKSVEEVCSQIWATLYDYPCLKSCPGLVQYVKDAVRLAWCLVNQSPPYVLEYEQRVIRKDVHVRFHTSNPESDQIRTYLWPALLEGAGGPCVYKAVVVT